MDNKKEDQRGLDLVTKEADDLDTLIEDETPILQFSKYSTDK
jgi:hypothetical protein